jgi:hypothetical protein
MTSPRTLVFWPDAGPWRLRFGDRILWFRTELYQTGTWRQAGVWFERIGGMEHGGSWQWESDAWRWEVIELITFHLPWLKGSLIWRRYSPPVD